MYAISALELRKVRHSASHASHPVGVFGLSHDWPMDLTRSSCFWCDRRFRVRQSGGHVQRFCSHRCPLMFHTAAGRMLRMRPRRDGGRCRTPLRRSARHNTKGERGGGRISQTCNPAADLHGEALI